MQVGAISTADERQSYDEEEGRVKQEKGEEKKGVRMTLFDLP